MRILFLGSKDKETRSNDFENSDLMEDRPRAKKGLAVLKDYDHMEEFTYSNPSRNERDSSASSAAEKVSSKIFNYVGTFTLFVLQTSYINKS